MSTSDAVARLISDPVRAKAVSHSILLARQLRELESRRRALVAEQDRLRSALPEWASRPVEVLVMNPENLKNTIQLSEVKTVADLDKVEKQLNEIDRSIEQVERRIVETQSVSLQEIEAVMAVALERMKTVITRDPDDVFHDHGEHRMLDLVERAHADILTLLQRHNYKSRQGVAKPSGRTISIDDLEQKLRKYINLAAAGETVLVLDREHVVAELGPPQAGRSFDLADSLLADAVRQGLVTPAALPPGEPPPAPPGVMSLEELLGELDRSREDR